jgi:hypothetical protein
MIKSQAPRQQNRKKNKEAMNIFSRRKNASPQRRIFRNKEDSRRQIQKECITKNIIYIPKYQRLFYGRCFNCSNFGHKVVNYITYANKKRNNTWYLNNNYPRISYEEYTRNQNNFGSLSNEVECYKCNNFGHIANNCRLTIPPRESKKNISNQISKPQEIWKINMNQCSLVLQAQHRKSDWYVDNDFSKHMIGDINNFITLKK